MSGDLVVLLHGIARTSGSLRGVGNALRGAGYEVIAPDYPSRRYALGDLASWLAVRLAADSAWPPAGKLHFVTHSMGGLVAARLLADHGAAIPPGQLGRIVALAPPFQGSEVADFLVRFPPYRWFYGPAGGELTTARRPERPDYELGVIAGTTGWPYLLGSLLIAKPHDGRVSEARTKVDGMGDHLSVPATHSFIADNRVVQQQVLHFLRSGRFAR